MVVGAVGGVLGREVMFCPEIAGPVVAQTVGILRAGDVAILENTRFWPGEEKNDPELAKAIAANADFYVNDAFSAAHRAHATTEGLAHLLPAYAGRSMQAELEALEKALGNPARPVAAVVGGAKVSSKLDVLTHLVGQVDHLIIGGGMANTFLAAKGVDVGKSLCEHELAGTVAKSLPRRTRRAAPCICPMMSRWRRNSPPIPRPCGSAMSMKSPLTR